jgi:hypothetical protein
MPDQWKSIRLYEHPAKHQAGTFGNVVHSTVGVYAMKVGGGMMSCPQDWAAKIQHDEQNEKETAVILRNMPETVRNQLKARAAMEGKSMQGLVLELITRYLSH